MKKSFIFSIIFGLCVNLFAQTNVTIDLDDDLYNFLEIAQTSGYCEPLKNVKPYTQSYILQKLSEIKEKIMEQPESFFTNQMLKTVTSYENKFKTKTGLDLYNGSYRVEWDNKVLPSSFQFSNTTEGFISTGLYKQSDINSTGFELFHNFNFSGDLGKHVSYRSTGFIGVTQMPLQKMGDDYYIGLWWYDDADWLANKEKNPLEALANSTNKRTIKSYRMNSVLPYSYKKKWDGSIYYLSNISASGLEDWPSDTKGMGFGMYGDIHASFFEDRLNIGISRVNREWAGMDYGSSLILNSNASPFFAFDIDLQVLKHFSFSTMTGVLEFPNAAYIDSDAWYNLSGKDPIYDADGNFKGYETINKDKTFNPVDSYFFQNLFSIGMLNIDFKYAHLDFGSTCIWPKRMELGYMFPLIDRVVYQNSVGDYDNLALFFDIKGIIPSIGNVWVSYYMDEINKFNTSYFTKARCMFAYQAGTKANIPVLPFTTFTFRYTKVEPYCYTHQAIRKQPWYPGYISEAYMNNGRPLGYYLDPNSDEFFARLETRAFSAFKIGLQYQLIRHGADFGSGQVAGSSIWSEIPTGDREVYYKYFLHDGTYEWTNVIALDVAYDLNAYKIPLQLYCGAGYVYDYFTQSEKGSNTKSAYHKVNTSEYPTKNGVVLFVGFKAFNFALFH